MTAEIVRYQEHRDIAMMTMDDGKANALSYEMLKQLDAAFDRAESDAKGVVLTYAHNQMRLAIAGGYP